MKRHERTVARVLPDLFGVFCNELTCRATVDLDPESARELQRLYGRRKRGVISHSAKYRANGGGVHVLASLRKSDKGPVEFFFGMHAHTTPEERESRVSSVITFLDTIGEIFAETSLVVTGAFRYPQSQYRPSIVFPGLDELRHAVGPDAPVSITGLRFRLGAGAVQSVIMDVHNPEVIFLSTQILVRARISGGLPQECLKRVSEATNILVVPSASTGGKT